MEKKLMAYRGWLKLQLFVIVLGLAAIAGAVIFLPGTAREQDWYPDFFRGFIGGASGAVAAMLLWQGFRCLRALGDMERLKRMYLKDMDEREAAIASQGVSIGARIYLLMSLPAMILAGYLSLEVFFTIMAGTVLLGLLCALGKLYYRRKL